MFVDSAVNDANALLDAALRTLPAKAKQRRPCPTTASATNASSASGASGARRSALLVSPRQVKSLRGAPMSPHSPYSGLRGSPLAQSALRPVSASSSPSRRGSPHRAPSPHADFDTSTSSCRSTRISAMQPARSASGGNASSFGFVTAHLMDSNALLAGALSSASRSIVSPRHAAEAEDSLRAGEARAAQAVVGGTAATGNQLSVLHDELAEARLATRRAIAERENMAATAAAAELRMAAVEAEAADQRGFVAAAEAEAAG